MILDTILILSGFFALLAGLAGSILPLPGPPLSLLGLFLIHWSRKIEFSSEYLWTFGILTLLITILDTIIPVLGQKKFGGTKLGVVGGILGMIIGMAGGIIGLLLGTFIGGLIGELLSGKPGSQAMKASFGAFAGFVFGSLLKMVLCLAMLFTAAREFF
ncbi:MAG: DUF456 domain-containing protein [Saprospiraceae bacterium]|nr:DUF456 domain-containing protein [Saprospiraceae bacterium]